MEILWGIDLGGTKIEGIVFENTYPARILDRVRVPTQRDKGYLHILNQVAAVVRQLSTETGLAPATVGVGHPGVIEPSSQLIKNSNSTVLNGKPLKKDLINTLGVPVVMANDANCLVMAETRLGVVRDVLPDAAVVFGVIMGTGVGGGLVINGQIIRGRHNIAGEWGHNFLDVSGGKCYCGKIGCVEKVISGMALQEYYQSISGYPLSLKEITKRNEQGTDPHATKTLKRLVHYFGKAIANVINIVDPDAIVIGGGLGNIDLLYSAGVKSASRFVFNDRLDTLFLKPKLGDSGGVFGAGLLTAK